jgi:hypothetical protein
MMDREGGKTPPVQKKKEHHSAVLTEYYVPIYIHAKVLYDA